MPATKSKTTETFSAEEKAAMRERAKEAKAQQSAVEAEAEVRAKIAELPEPDRAIAERLHTLITDAAPELAARTWYGMPAYARNGKIVCFFKPASKFSSRYATFGFEEEARLDDGTIWPTSWAITELTPAGEAEIAAVVKKAVS
jgi:uncharacterized protein YdhG (YjbR/CyaY superfamily)